MSGDHSVLPLLLNYLAAASSPDLEYKLADFEKRFKEVLNLQK